MGYLSPSSHIRTFHRVPLPSAAGEEELHALCEIHDGVFSMYAAPASMDLLTVARRVRRSCAHCAPRRYMPEVWELLCAGGRDAAEADPIARQTWIAGRRSRDGRLKGGKGLPQEEKGPSREGEGHQSERRGARHEHWRFRMTRGGNGCMGAGG